MTFAGYTRLKEKEQFLNRLAFIAYKIERMEIEEMTITSDHPKDKEQQYPPPVNTDDHYEQPPHVNHHHREEPPFSPLPPPFDQFRSYREISIHLTHLLLHLTGLNHQNVCCHYCDDDSSLPPTPNANGDNRKPPDTFDYYLAESHRLAPPSQPSYHVSPQCSHHSLHNPPIICSHSNHQNPTNYTDNKPTFRVYTKAKTDYSLTIRNGKVILAPTNSSDLHQHWIKDDKLGSSIKDEKGKPAFALVNKATGEAMKFSIGETYPVQLKKYNPDEIDMSVLWSQGNDCGDGYRSFRTKLFCGNGTKAITKSGSYSRIDLCECEVLIINHDRCFVSRHVAFLCFLSDDVFK
ncbi:unnamed protein product [Lactuca virosa]|uniref:Uncharacterized protein n=1 Tax=Lactuca virosa TaxID=75947 RepID=A0AAU9NFQ2_9ASTR|nr:unnamed protein product [Lactuca virosa]